MNIDRKKIRIFLCALWPGGGYMYFGMMKKGTMVMALFTAVAGLTLTIGWKFLAFLLPVIWCYCFFDTFHVAKLPEEIREFEDQDCWDTVVAFLKSDPLKRVEEKKTLAGVLILLAALYTMIYGVFLPFFRWSEELRLVRMALTAIPPAVIAVLLFMVGRNILQKEQDRKDAEAGIAETDAPDVEETALEEGNVEQLVEAVLGAEAEKEAEETAEAEEVEAENADKAEETEKTEIKETA
nr:hypothetical protein [uncultured Anaerotignum sp.]